MKMYDLISRNEELALIFIYKNEGKLCTFEITQNNGIVQIPLGLHALYDGIYDISLNTHCFSMRWSGGYITMAKKHIFHYRT